MNPDFEAKKMCCRAVFNVLREGVNVLRNFIINTLEVLRNTLILQSVARKAFTTQWGGGSRNSATLLPSKYLYIYICTYMPMCIGVSNRRRSKCCATRLSLSGGVA